MYQWRPSQWLKWAPLTVLPFIASYAIQTNSLVEDITNRAQAAAGDWAKVVLDGRDVVLSGDAKSKALLDDAVKAVAGTYGVRTVDAKAVKILPPPAPEKLGVDAVAPPLPALTLPAAGAVWPYAISGTWPEGEAKGLSAKLADKTYVLGADEALKSDGKGNFTFDPRVDLKPGSYDLNVMVTDAAGNQTALDAKAAVVVPETAPAQAAAGEPAKVEAPKAETPKVETPKVEAAPAAAPTIVAVSGNNSSPMLSGTYPKDAAKLSVAVGGKTYVLNTDKELTVDDAGNWMLMPNPLADGDYSVGVKVEDAGGTQLAMSPTQNLTIDTKPPAAPTVNPAAADAVWPYAVTGTWPEGDAKSMSLSLLGQAYTLGKDKELISDGKGAFTFLPSTQLAPGSYDLDFTVSDAMGNINNAVLKGAIVIPEAAPAVAAAPVVEPAPAVAPAQAPAVAAAPAPAPLVTPTVDSVVSDSDHPTIKGTWPAGKANSLTVSLDGTSYKLGTDFDLLSDASGHWTLKPKAPIVNGTYDVIAQITDAAGQTAIDSTKGELQVNVAPPPPAPAVGQPYDCVATMARISAVFPVRFEFKHANLKAPYDLSVNQYSALMKDPRCLTMKVQVAGHADYLGSEFYNQGLSERRAKTVIDALVAAGIDAGRLTGVGYSKDKPLDPALTASARMKNRRVEFTVLN